MRSRRRRMSLQRRCLDSEHSCWKSRWGSPGEHASGWHFARATNYCRSSSWCSCSSIFDSWSLAGYVRIDRCRSLIWWGFFHPHRRTPHSINLGSFETDVNERTGSFLHLSSHLHHQVEYFSRNRIYFSRILYLVSSYYSLHFGRNMANWPPS